MKIRIQSLFHNNEHLITVFNCHYMCVEKEKSQPVVTNISKELKFFIKGYDQKIKKHQKNSFSKI